MKMSLLIRADADERSGIGHVMRCLAFGQYAHDRGCRVTFVTHSCPAVQQRLRDEGFAVVPLDHPGTAAEVGADKVERIGRQCAPDWVVLDGYHFTASCHRAWRSCGARLAVFDDTASLDAYDADLVINQNLRADRLHYPTSPGTTLLLGTQYAQLRREFRRFIEWRRPSSTTARRLLVTLGGSDSRGQLPKALDALAGLSARLVVTVVRGVAATDDDWVQKHPAADIHELRVLHAPDNMAQLMADADLAIAASGSTSWELAFMQLPAISIVVADNQREAARGMDEQGAACCLGWYERVASQDIAHALRRSLDDAALRQRMSQAGRRLVDGLGPQRLHNTMEEMLHAAGLHR